jgi:hypothetical protein
VNLSRLLLVTLLAVVGCIREEASGPAKKALSRAVERTLSAESFHIETVATYEGKDHPAEVNYVAPDRIWLGDASSSEETIYIGHDMYLSAPGASHQFFHAHNPCGATIEFVVSALATAQEADEVRLVGDTYVFDTRDATVSGEARIDDGVLSLLVVHYPLAHLDEVVTERHTFSGFGEEYTIEPPSPEQVLPTSDPTAAPGAVVQGGSAPPCR